MDQFTGRPIKKWRKSFIPIKSNTKRSFSCRGWQYPIVRMGCRLASWVSKQMETSNLCELPPQIDQIRFNENRQSTPEQINTRKPATVGWSAAARAAEPFNHRSHSSYFKQLSESGGPKRFAAQQPLSTGSAAAQIPK